MRYYKKKDILRNMGKDEKDVRALERAIKKGRVIQEEVDWMVRWITRSDYDMDSIVRLTDRVRQLEATVADLNKKANSDDAVNAQYYEDLYNKEYERNEKIIRKCYEFMRSRGIRLDWEEYRESIDRMDE